MKKFILATLAIASLILFDQKPAKTQPFNPLLASMLQDSLNYYLSAIPNIKGMSASVYIPGQGVWTGVGGISYAGQPITSDMRFGIASNSKLFTSAMMLKLAENNIISLEDSLKDWLTISNSNINPNITIRQLLNHSSGISDPFFVSPWFDTINANPTRVFTPEEVLGWVGAPLFPAGTSWGYSNTNYVLAGMVAQSASGHSLAKLIRDSILTPLNLSSSFIDVEEPVNGTIAHRWWNLIDYHDTSRVGLNSAAGYAGSIFSTASEMVLWYNALFSGQIINQSSMNELTTFLATTNPNYQYGLGLSRDITQGLQYWGHGGSTWGYKSKMIYDTCLHVSVAGLTNSFPSGMDGVTFVLYRIIKNHLPGCSGAITGPVTVCQGQNNVVYSVSPIANASSYIWTLPGGATGTSNTNSITINFGVNAASDTIAVKGVNLYGEGITSILPVTVNVLPGNVTVNGGGTYCKSTTLTATGGSGGTIYWQGTTNNGTSMATQSSSQTISVPGTYYFRAYNNTCGWGNQGSAIVAINTLPNATITPSGSTSFCTGGNVVLNVPASANRTYQWKKSGSLIPGANLPSYTATTNGNYKVLVTNTVTGCSKTTTNATVVTVNTLPTATITPQGPTTFCSGDHVVLQANTGAGLTYKWKKWNNFIAGATLPNYTASSAGTYKVQVTNSNGCSKTSPGTLITINCKSAAEINNYGRIQLFPNPAVEIVTLQFSSDEIKIYDFIITDTEGREIIHESIRAISGTNEHLFDMSPFANGVYLVKLQSLDGVFNDRIVKQ